jgi:hypothetical protein
VEGGAIEERRSAFARDIGGDDCDQEDEDEGEEDHGGGREVPTEYTENTE